MFESGSIDPLFCCIGFNKLKSIVDELEKIISPALTEAGVELVKVQVKGRSGSQVVKVFVDCVEGVTLDKCTHVSRLISDQLDIVDLISGKYRLEVSSPGVSRPLQTTNDFKRNLNREVEIVFTEDREQHSIRGEILQVSDDSVSLKNKDAVRSVPISAIQHGKLMLPW